MNDTFKITWNSNQNKQYYNKYVPTGTPNYDGHELVDCHVHAQ